MKIRSLFCTVVCLAFTASVVADEPQLPTPPKHPGLDRLKKLAGEWVALDENGKPADQVVAVYKVTSAGSAVQETIFPGADHEMITMYYVDGKDLVMTHYCALGNQPHLKADSKSSKNQLQFKFVSGANIDVKTDMHMHEGTITFVDEDHIHWEWTAYRDGKPDEEHKVSIKLARKK